MHEIQFCMHYPQTMLKQNNIRTQDQNVWFFFSNKDKKYPTSTRNNRATTVVCRFPDGNRLGHANLREALPRGEEDAGVEEEVKGITLVA